MSMAYLKSIIDQGNYKEAMTYIPQLPVKLKTEGMIYQSYLLSQLGEYEEALNTSMMALKDSNLKSRIILEIGARATLADAVIGLGEYDKSDQIIKKSELLIELL